MTPLASAVREELTRMSATLEQRFDEIERFDVEARSCVRSHGPRSRPPLRALGRARRRGGNAQRTSDRACRRASRAHGRSLQPAPRHAWPANWASGCSTAKSALASVSEAISSIMQRLAEVEEHQARSHRAGAEGGVERRLEARAVRERARPARSRRSMTIPTPTRRQVPVDDFELPAFDETEDAFNLSDPEPQPYAVAADAAQPMRAAPLPPLHAVAVLREQPNDHDIYFAEEIDDLLPSIRTTPLMSVCPAGIKSIEISPDDDLLIDDPALDETDGSPRRRWTTIHSGRRRRSRAASDRGRCRWRRARPPQTGECRLRMSLTKKRRARPAETPNFRRCGRRRRRRRRTITSPTRARRRRRNRFRRRAMPARKSRRRRSSACVARAAWCLWGAAGIIAVGLVGGASTI
jgi:hypothetical protein